MATASILPQEDLRVPENGEKVHVRVPISKQGARPEGGTTSEEPSAAPGG